jgi:inactivated superfamily I helicase
MMKHTFFTSFASQAVVRAVKVMCVMVVMSLVLAAGKTEALVAQSQVSAQRVQFIDSRRLPVTDETGAPIAGLHSVLSHKPRLASLND